MKTALYIISALLLVSIGLYVHKHLKNKDCREKLDNCLNVPNFDPRMFNVQEFTGARKKILYKVECRNLSRVEDFYDEGRCSVVTEDVSTKEQIILSQDEYNGRLFSSRYITNWVDTWDFFIDLSDPKDWTTSHENRTLTFTGPKISVKRLAIGNKQLNYVLDKAFWSNNSKIQFKMARFKENYAERQALNYLENEYALISKEMEESIRAFVKNLSSKLGYADYTINVTFEPL